MISEQKAGGKWFMTTLLVVIVVTELVTFLSVEQRKPGAPGGDW